MTMIPSGHSLARTPNFTPQQMDLFKSLLGSLQEGGGLGGGIDFMSQLAQGDEAAFGQAEAPAYSAFNKMMGQQASRFSQYGARDSSAFQNAISGGAAGLSEQLQEKRLGLQSSAIERLLGLSGDLLGQRPYDTSLVEKSPGMDWAGLGGKGAEGAGNILGSMLRKFIGI